jgi:(S)-sulfolactate dehydrogenase
MTNTRKLCVVIAEFMDGKAVDALRARYNVHYDPELFGNREALLQEMRGAHALIVRNNTRVTASLIESAPELRVVARLGVGVDNIDLGSCKKRGIAVYPATGANAQSVAEYTIAAILFLQRDLFGRSAQTAAGVWPRSAFTSTREAHGKTLGIIGFGDIGQRVARLARAFEMRVLATDPAHPDDSSVWADADASPRDFSTLLRESDFVSLHLPLDETTRDLFDHKMLALMKRGACLINTARGGIVNEAALARFLREERLAGAVIDVFSEEPLRAASPLAELPNVWLTPHIAGLTRESNTRVSAVAAQKVDEALSRLP